MKFTVLFLVISAVSLISAQTDCSTSVETCLNDPVCNSLLESYSLCTQNVNNANYGCDIYNNNTQANPGYRASCNYMCYWDAASNSTNANFTNYGNCLLNNVTLIPTFFSSCNDQQYITNCVNTTLYGLACAANLNDLVNCYNGNPPVVGVCALVEPNSPGFQASCGYQCNLTVQNPTPQYAQAVSCALSDLLVFPNCNSEFANCISENTGGYVCPSNLNQALLSAQTNSACQGFNSTTWNSTQISACANATFGAVNNTANDAYWNSLDICVATNINPTPSPTPSPNPSSNSTTPSSSTSSGSFGSKLAAGIIFLAVAWIL